MLTTNKCYCICFFLIHLLYASFSYLIALNRTSRKILCNGSNRRLSYFVSYLKFSNEDRCFL